MKGLVVLFVMLFGGALPVAGQEDKATLYRPAAEQIVERGVILCKVAAYRSTTTDYVIGNIRPDGTAIVAKTILLEGVVVESYKGDCRPGDFVIFTAGGTEGGQKPLPQPVVRNKRSLFYIQASGLEKTDDGRMKLVDAERVFELHVPALEALLREMKLKQ